MDHWLLVEVDAARRMAHAELFAHDHLGDADLDSTSGTPSSAPEGPERERAATTARCVEALPPRTLARGGDRSAETTEFQDHRRLGLLRSGRVSASDLASYETPTPS